jgi:glutathione peroxidase
MQTIYDIPTQDIKGNTTNLDAYRGQVMLIVNVASRCGFTSQYKQLEKWYRQYQRHGFVVLGFPCNQFAGQEPEENANIYKFAQSCFAVTFPLFAKVDVNGEHKAPIYRFLQKNFKEKCFLKRIPWNFTKFLVNRQGEVCARFWPIAPRWWVEKCIQRMLEKEQ